MCLKKKGFYFLRSVIYGCTGSLVLCLGFLQLWRAGAALVVVLGLLIAVVSLVAEQALGVWRLELPS